MNRVGRWVASQTERPDLPVALRLLDSPSINAFAAPGGYVLITRGLYEIPTTRRSLQRAWAEIGHIVRRHHINGHAEGARDLGRARAAQRDNRSQLINNMIGTGAEVFRARTRQERRIRSRFRSHRALGAADIVPTGWSRCVHSSPRAGPATPRLRCGSRPIRRRESVLTELGNALAPRVAQLPAGKSCRPQVLFRPAAAARVQARAGGGCEGVSRAEGTTFPSAPGRSGKGGAGIDPAGVLRGIFAAEASRRSEAVMRMMKRLKQRAGCRPLFFVVTSP